MLINKFVTCLELATHRVQKIIPTRTGMPFARGYDSREFTFKFSIGLRNWQLVIKRKTVLDVMKAVGRELTKLDESLVPWWLKNRRDNDGACCPVEPCLGSPVVEGYRNKCEFTVGLHAATNLPTIGFRLSSYKAGSTCVAPVDNLAQVSDVMKEIVKVGNWLNAWTMDMRMKHFVAFRGDILA